MPEVSVVIPTYNCAQYLPRALESVFAQTYRDFEVLVIDDGSTDDTEKVVCDCDAPVRYIRQENQGVARARNRGVAESRSRYVAFLDADDFWCSKKLELQLAKLARHEDCGVCYCDFLVVGSDGQRIEITPLTNRRSVELKGGVEDLLTFGNLVGGGSSSVLCDRALLVRVGGFDPDLSQCADWDMWIRLAMLTSFVYVPEKLLAYRIHGNNMSRNVDLLERDSVMVLQKAFSNADLPRDLHCKQRQALARNYTVLAGSYFHTNSYLDCFRCAILSLFLDPRQGKAFAGFPVRVASRWRLRSYP